MISRRGALAVFGLAMIAPGSARSQGVRRRPLVGVIRAGAKVGDRFPELFGRGMAALGWVDGQNMDFLVSWADERNERLRDLATHLVSRGADVIVTFGDLATRAAQKATAAIPIVAMADDLVASGMVRSLARPGGNITGVSILASELDAKRLEVLRDVVPSARRIGVLRDPSTTDSMPAVAAAGRALGVELVVSAAQKRDEIGPACDSLIRAQIDAVNVLASPFLNRMRGNLIAALALARLPAIYQWPESAEAGGLVAYGPSTVAVYHQVAGLVDKLLRGARPENLPVEQPTKIELVVNLKAMRQLAIKVPQGVLLRADRVIE